MSQWTPSTASKSKALSSGHLAGLTYHQRMLADPHRLVAYDRAIRVLVRPGDVVLDVGSGTGILSMLAARAGARVHAVESQDVAQIARDLARRNKLNHAISHHQADIRELPVAEPVDLIISDFMGRFVIDDNMQEAMKAAQQWLKPDGRVCPNRVELMLAPAAIGHFPALDTGETPLLGLDFSSVSSHLLGEAFGAHINPEMLLCEPQLFAQMDPGTMTNLAWRRSHEFDVSRPGRLRGVAGWFVAYLAPGVVLSTAPGFETHWGQMLFPTPVQLVDVGDRIQFELAIEHHSNEEAWRWSCHVKSGAAETQTDEDGECAPQLEGSPTNTQSLLEFRNNQAIRAFQAGRFAEAALAFQGAIDELPNGGGKWAPELYENLGLAYLNAGNFVAAIPAFLRSLDGDLHSRQQSAQYLVDACFQCHRYLDGERYLKSYEAAFGSHPSNWTKRIEP